AYFCTLLTRHEVQGILQVVPFENSGMGRELVYFDVKLANNLVVTFATSHLESPVGPTIDGKKEIYTKQRRRQLELSLETLSNRRHVMFGGDMNWVDPTAKEENDGWMKLSPSWKDCWIEAHGQNYLQTNPGYTYDGVNNPMLGHRYRSRLDRILFKSEGSRLQLKTIDIIGTQPIPRLTYTKTYASGFQKQVPVLPSDHFGLFAVFKVAMI
ncbi:hypothetical protein RFI_13942, partial [Reticulomyxa filosa]